MDSSKGKSFRKLKKQHTWFSILMLVLVVVLLSAVINMGAIFFALQTIDTKVDDEYKLIRHVAEMYEESLDEDKEDLRDILERNAISYFVLDRDRNEVASQGENTCTDIGGYPDSFLGKKPFVVYEDAEDKHLLFENGMIVLSLKVLGWSENDIAVDESTGSEALADDERVISSGYVEMPIWIGTELSDGSMFVGKGTVKIRLSVVFVVLIAVIALNSLILFVMIFRIIGIVRGLIRRKKLTELFLVDEATKGNNWMAFLLKGEQILKKKKNADKRYAIVHLVIVKYRNYCMCHTLEEGRYMLFQIAGVISRSLSPKEELSAHVSSSSFALLIEGENDDAIRDRLQSLLDQLTHVNTDAAQSMMAGHTNALHAFNFQLGVQVIEPNIVDGKKQKRRNPEIEKYYNNAVTAKATLETTDDSGIAFFDDKLLENERWVEMVEEFQNRALENEEFVVYYQPKYSPDEGKLVGAEALIRWQSPELGFVPPGRFIPIFEKNGFITSIDHYMICHVAQDQKKWLDAGMNCVPVSVNVSRAHFAESDLADQIRNMVDEAGTPHEYIEIELTESAFFDDKNALIRTIECLKSYGFSVSMDDFGSGYSSLNSLKDMNLDVLKLDAEFFRGDADPERKEAVISEAIRLAKKLNMRIVAEGVEEREQVEFLDKQGCDMIQGYYFAKPMPKSDFEERMVEVYHK